MLSKQALISVTNILQPWALKHNMLFITRVFTSTQCAYPMQPGDTLPTTKIPGKVMATHPEPKQGLHLNIALGWMWAGRANHAPYVQRLAP